MIILFLILLPLTEQHAFLSDYGEPCDNFTECKDHRMACTGEESNKICTCVKYYEWKGAHQGCVQMYDGERIMRFELIFNNISAEIDREQDMVFALQLWAGAFVVVVYIIAIVAVMIFCAYVRLTDTAMHRDLHDLKMKIGKDTFSQRETVEAPA